MSEEQDFCMKQFKPVVLAIIFLLVIVIVWTIYHEIHRDHTGTHVKHVKPHKTRNIHKLQTVAAPGKIPIAIGQIVPHGNYGNNCLMCHSLPAGDQKPAIPAGPVAWTTPMPHPYWGECTKCHKMTGVAPAAYIDMLAGSDVFGAELITVTPAIAKQYHLASNEGVLVNNVQKNSLAMQAGLVEGDVIVNADRQVMKDAGQLNTILANKKQGDKLRLKIVRNKTKRRNLKVVLKDIAALHKIQSANIGILSAGKTLKGQVAYSFVNSPYMVVYNTQMDTFDSVANMSQGMHGNAVSNWVISQDVGKIIVGNINASDLDNLRNAKVKVYSGVFGSVSDAITLFEQGQLKENLTQTAKPAAFAQNTVNLVAIPSNFPDPAANVHNDFGTAQYFIIVELDTNRYEVKTNPNFNDIRGNGVQTAQFLVDNHVDAVIADQINTKTANELKKLGVHLYPHVNMSVGDAVLSLKNKKLKATF